MKTWHRLDDVLAADSQLTVMSTVCVSVSMSLTAVHSYVPAFCLEIVGISRYSSSDVKSPGMGSRHTHMLVTLSL